MTASRLLIVNADDFGLTAGVCEAILSAHERGIVTSTSALAVAPAFDQYAGALSASGLGVGAHLCAVGEDPPLLSATEVPTLVDERGRFPLTWRAFVARSVAGRVDADDLRREFGAQVERLRQAGARLTHVDAHQNLHLWPGVSRVLFEIAAKESIGAARLPRTRRWAPPSVGVRVLGRTFGRACRAAGIATPSASEGLDEAGRLSESAMCAAIARLGASGARAAELACHPGVADDPDRARYKWSYRWAEEREALLSTSARRAVDAAGFVLGDFGDLLERTRGDAAA